MSTLFEIPERCLLAQAARYIVGAGDPIPDQIYLSSPALAVDWTDELIWALRSKILSARADLFDAMYDEENGTWEEWRLLEKDVEVDADLWSRDRIDLAKSSLRVRNKAVRAKFGFQPLQTFYHMEATDEVGPETGFVLCNVTLPTKELFQNFPPCRIQPKSSSPDEGQPSEPIKGAGGRPPKYRWNELYIHLIVTAHFDGLPETLAELVSQAAQWCTDNWGDAPSESVLKERLAPIFKHPRMIPRDQAGN